MTALSPSASISHAAIMEDCIDQLSILGRILPVSYHGQSDSKERVGKDVRMVLDSQRDIESKFESLLSARQEGTAGNISGSHQMKSLTTSIAVSNRFVSQTVKQNPLTNDNLVKVQSDRQFCEEILNLTYHHLLHNQDFRPLLEAVRAEKEKKAALQQKIIKEEQGRRKIKQLQKHLQDIKKEKELEIQQRNEMIAHLKDQLQEMKAKSNMEGKYVKKNAENQVHQNQQRCVLQEQDQKDRLELLRVQYDEEVRTHTEIQTYLKTHQKILEEKVEEWMQKYDKDVEAKQNELTTLKQNKASDLQKLQELTRTYGEYEKVVVEDRIEKEKERRKREQEEMELQAAIKAQSWWRAMMVRKQLGPFSKKKKKGGKKGGKKGKKGKKK